MSFETFPSNNQAENNQEKDLHDQQVQDLHFMLNRSYDQPGYENPLDRIQHTIDDYPLLSQEEIVDIYLSEQEYETIAASIDKFPEVDPKAIASKFVEAGQAHHVLRNLDKFPGVSKEDLEKTDLQDQTEQSDRLAA